ncbi:zinc-binding dehydrogenase [Nocardia sp. NPDC059246]|uniref:zinc-binding dehydrogenase n=1 Tax=unclassified Nocardia TaxID=2637762 RepID=UPI003695EBDC
MQIERPEVEPGPGQAQVKAAGIWQAAVAADAIATAYHAVKPTASVTADTTVAIVGLGGLGSNGAQVAAWLGAAVLAVDPDPAARKRAEAVGIETTFETLTELTDRRPDVIIDFTGVDVTTAEAVTVVKPASSTEGEWTV